MKRRFEFRLARLARVRDVLEQTARADWSRAEGTARDAESEWEASRDEREAAQRALAGDLASGPLDPRSVLLSQTAIDQLGTREHSRREHARTLRWQAEQLQEAWQARENDRRALEKLEERDRKRHREALEQEAQAELDEVASVRHARQTSPETSDSSFSSGAPDLPDRDSPPDP